MRFEVCKFPSLYGTPWKTNFYLLALIFSVIRLMAVWNPGEIRVIDNKTKEHPIVW